MSHLYCDVSLLTSQRDAPPWLSRISLTAEVRIKMSYPSRILFKATVTFGGSTINLKLLLVMSIINCVSKVTRSFNIMEHQRTLKLRRDLFCPGN